MWTAFHNAIVRDDEYASYSKKLLELGMDDQAKVVELYRKKRLSWDFHGRTDQHFRLKDRALGALLFVMLSLSAVAIVYPFGTSASDDYYVTVLKWVAIGFLAIPMCFSLWWTFRPKPPLAEVYTEYQNSTSKEEFLTQSEGDISDGKK